MLGRLKKSAPIIILFLIFLAPPLHAQWSWSITEADVYLWTGLAVSISAIFIGLAYMAARLFELAVLEAWVKIELRELMTSIVIAVFCVTLIASANAAAQFLTGEGGSTTIVDGARDFARDRVYSDGQLLYLKLAEAYFNIAKIASYSYTAGTSIGILSFSYSASPASGISPLVSEVGQAMDTVSNFMLLAAAQSAFLKFFGAASALMLPVGIFLRSFSLTRKIGGVLLAAVIASAVLYPAGFFVAKEVYGSFRDDMRNNAENIRVEPAQNPPAASTVCSAFMQRFVQGPIPFLGGEMGWFVAICVPTCIPLSLVFPGCFAVCYEVISTVFYIAKAVFPIIVYFAALLPFANKIGSTTFLMDGYYQPLQQFALPAVAKYSVLSLVVFFIPLIVAMVMLRNLAITFGGEPQLYGISKLI